MPDLISDKQLLQSFAALEQEAQAILADIYSDPESPDILLVDNDRVKSWGKNVVQLLENVFGRKSTQYLQFTQKFRGEIHANAFRTSLAVFKSIHEKYEKFLIRTSTVRDVLMQAKQLLNVGEKDAACMMTGVALEAILRELCQLHSSAPKEILNQSAGQANQSLYKAGVYSRLTSNQIADWLGMQKKASRGAQDEFSAKDVLKMFQGVTRLMADYLI